MNGKVYLVGAGPGDPELLTLRALRVLREADLVLHDDLVSPAILNLAAPGAELVNVGKRCGRKSASQEEIDARMIAGARQGLMVVRLKGGDPSVFARAGEEIEALRQAEVEFEIVPGVTAASAASAAAGISLTHRRVASTVVFFTGHPAVGKDHNSQDEWSALRLRDGRLDATLVVYMPGPDYSSLQGRLLGAGVPGETPCLLVSVLSAGGSLRHRTTVDKLENSPVMSTSAILIVGNVVKLAPSGPTAARSSHWQILAQPAVAGRMDLEVQSVR